MSGPRPRFNIVAKNAKTKEKTYLFAGWPPDGDFAGFNLSVNKDRERGMPKVSIKVEYQNGDKEVITLDPANKASTHFLTLFDNGEDEEDWG